MALPKVGGGFVKAGDDAVAKVGKSPTAGPQVDHTSVSMEVGIDPPMSPENAAAELRDILKAGPPSDPIFADHVRKLRRLARGF